MSGFIIYIVVSIFTPGPNNIFSSISAGERGFTKTIPFMIGIGLGTTLVFLSAAFVNNYVLQGSVIYNYIGVIGGLFIVYLGVLMLLGKSIENRLFDRDYLVLKAIFLNFINPKTLLFGLTIAVYYTKMDLPISLLYWFMVLMGILCFVAVAVWAIFGQIFQVLLKNKKMIYHLIMGILLCYSGALIVIESI